MRALGPSEFSRENPRAGNTSGACLSLVLVEGKVAFRIARRSSSRFRHGSGHTIEILSARLEDLILQMRATLSHHLLLVAVISSLNGGLVVKQPGRRFDELVK